MRSLLAEAVVRDVFEYVSEVMIVSMGNLFLLCYDLAHFCVWSLTNS